MKRKSLRHLKQKGEVVVTDRPNELTTFEQFGGSIMIVNSFIHPDDERLVNNTIVLTKDELLKIAEQIK